MCCEDFPAQVTRSEIDTRGWQKFQFAFRANDRFGGRGRARVELRAHLLGRRWVLLVKVSVLIGNPRREYAKSPTEYGLRYGCQDPAGNLRKNALRIGPDSVFIRLGVCVAIEMVSKMMVLCSGYTEDCRRWFFVWEDLEEKMGVNGRSNKGRLPGHQESQRYKHFPTILTFYSLTGPFDINLMVRTASLFLYTYGTLPARAWTGWVWCRVLALTGSWTRHCARVSLSRVDVIPTPLG